MNIDPPAPLPYVTSFTCDNVDYGGPQAQGECDGFTPSYFSRLSGKFHVCPFGIESQPTRATDIECSDLGDVVSSKMQSLTSTLIHEFMHSQNAGDATPTGKIQDAEYGAGSCMRIVTDKAKKPQRAFVNADSYQWFALNAFYNSYCDNLFGLPLVTQADFDKGMAQLYGSPEYNETLTSGILEGV